MGGVSYCKIAPRFETQTVLSCMIGNTLKVIGNIMF